MQEARRLVEADALEGQLAGDGVSLSEEGNGAKAYADAVCLYLDLAVSKETAFLVTLSRWRAKEGKSAPSFGRQAIPMVWDYADMNPFAGAGGDFLGIIESTAKTILNCPATTTSSSSQADAQRQNITDGHIVSTDPPYYDNIGYADLSDFFYVWLRRSLKQVFPGLFGTVAVPKAEELVATPYRHGCKEAAEEFFLNGMTLAMRLLAEQAHQGFPVTIYYAFKQSETENQHGTSSTGWETFLSAVIKSGFSLLGTWPLRTEMASRLIGSGSNALASSVILVCQRRDKTANSITRSEFRRQLLQDLPRALKELERANIAPVDVAQAAIGPGMAIYSKAKSVLNPDDSPMSVREALIEINAALDEYLSQDEADLDADSRFALTFFESFGYAEREFGDAEGLAKARNISVDGVARAGIILSVAGKVRLLQRSELPDGWDPTSDKRLCVWEATQQLIKRLEADGEGGAAALLLQLKNLPGHGDLAANCRALAYRLYNHCEKTKQAEEARSYNGLVIAWPELERQASAASITQSAPLQTSLI